MKKTFWFILALSISFFASCEIGDVKSSHQSFFDINDFLEQDLAQISELKSIKKKVEINGDVDEQVLKEFDLEKDLTIFRNSNINNIAWLDKYEVDSTMNNSGQLTELKYQATDSKLKTRELMVFYSNGKVNTILIKNASGNQVSDLAQTLQYNSMKGYSVESNQKVSLSKEQNLKIEVEYLNN